MPRHVKAVLLPWLAERSMTQRDLAKQIGITEQALCMELNNNPKDSGSIPCFNPLKCRQVAKILKLNAEDTRRLHLAAAADKGYEVLPMNAREALADALAKELDLDLNEPRFKRRGRPFKQFMMCVDKILIRLYIDGYIVTEAPEETEPAEAA